MNIVFKTEGINAKELYMLTKSSAVAKLSTLKGQEIDVDKAVLYEDTNSKTGEVIKVLALMLKDGKCYATNSGTFIRGYEDILTMFGDTGEPIPTLLKVAVGTSRAGREYLTCEIA